VEPAVFLPLFAMEQRAIHRNLSPLDHRYFEANRELFEQLADSLSEAAAVRYMVRVEAAILREHLVERGRLSSEVGQLVDGLEEQISAEEVAEEETETKHNVRALVNVIMRKLPENVAPFVHLGATSVDILDSAQSLRFRDATLRVVIPLLARLVERLTDLANAEADTPQVGRTHGQFAVPITFGFAVAEYASRLSQSAVRIRSAAEDLRGKLAGAVGAYNATGALVDDPVEFERRVLDAVDLQPAEHATQLVQPEFLLRLLLELNVAFGIIANLADDLRNLQRSEISEVHEEFGDKQVGSSTMPQKRNPWNAEHVKSLWKAFAPRVTTFYMDQISEHQRDLTNSASGRFVAEYFGGFVAATARILRVVERLRPDRERMVANLREAGDFAVAEAAYVLLAGHGDMSDAHELVRKATLNAQSSGRTLAEELEMDSEVWPVLEAACRAQFGRSAGDFLRDPGSYCGEAPSRARAVAESARRRIEAVQQGLL